MQYGFVEMFFLIFVPLLFGALLILLRGNRFAVFLDGPGARQVDQQIARIPALEHDLWPEEPEKWTHERERCFQCGGARAVVPAGLTPMLLSHLEARTRDDSAPPDQPEMTVLPAEWGWWSRKDFLAYLDEGPERIDTVPGPAGH